MQNEQADLLMIRTEDNVFQISKTTLAVPLIR